MINLNTYRRTHVRNGRTFELTRSDRAIFDGGRKLYDCDAARHAVSHMRLIDAINPWKVARAALTSFAMLAGENRDYYKGLKFKYKFK